MDFSIEPSVYNAAFSAQKASGDLHLSSSEMNNLTSIARAVAKVYNENEEIRILMASNVEANKKLATLKVFDLLQTRIHRGTLQRILQIRGQDSVLNILDNLLTTVYQTRIEEPA